MRYAVISTRFAAVELHQTHIMRYFLIIGVIATVSVIVVLYFGGVHSLEGPEATSTAHMKTTSLVPFTKLARLSQSKGSQVVNLEAFYQTIIDNNIFRPLNWEPPQRDSAYTLLGTFIATDGIQATAYIRERQTGAFFVISVGQQVNDATVTEITDKRVTLTTHKGKLLQLHLNVSRLLNSKGEQSALSKHRYEDVPQTTTEKETENMQKDRSKSVILPDPHQMQQRHLNQLKEKAAAIRAQRIRMQERLQQYERR